MHNKSYKSLPGELSTQSAIFVERIVTADQSGESGKDSPSIPKGLLTCPPDPATPYSQTLAPIQMGQFYYNRLKNNRIKGMSLGLLVVLTNVLAVYLYYQFVGKDNVSVFVVVAISFAAMGLLYIMGQIAFGQVIEKTNDGQVSTFIRLGTQKLKFKQLGRLVTSDLTQDEEKYYCLTIKTSDGHNLTLEKYPTLTEANERLEELRMRIG